MASAADDLHRRIYNLINYIKRGGDKMAKVKVNQIKMWCLMDKHSDNIIPIDGFVGFTTKEALGNFVEIDNDIERIVEVKLEQDTYTISEVAP